MYSIVGTSPYFRVFQGLVGEIMVQPDIYNIYVHSVFPINVYVKVCVYSLVIILSPKMCSCQFQYWSFFPFPPAATSPNSAAEVPSQVETILCGRIACEVGHGLLQSDHFWDGEVSL